LPNNHDVILCYQRAVGATWHGDALFAAYDLENLDEKTDGKYSHSDADGRRYQLDNLINPNPNRPNLTYEFLGVTRVWRWTRERMQSAYEQGLVIQPSAGAVPRFKRYLDEQRGRPIGDVWTDIAPINSQAKERLGYPTQKPEGLLERIMLAATDEGDVVADFVCGGGVTPAVAQRLGRRWIACDSSRVAVSVTLNRLVGLGEEQSGVRSNYGKAGQIQAKMDLPTPETAVPDIRVHYVGVYPMDRFKAVDQDRFDDFILKCLAAHSDNSDNAISGWRSAREPLGIGPADPEATPDASDVRTFVDDVLKTLQTNVRTVARYVCWRTSPELVAYRKTISDFVRRNVQPKGVDLDFDFLLIDSEDFRKRIREKYSDADDNEFLLRFTKEPVIGEIAATRTGSLAYRFEAPDADSNNAGGYLVNCQWDFDYQRGHFAAHRDYVLGRTEIKGKAAKTAGRKYEAVLAAEHTFEKAGTRTVACRVQDNLGAEIIGTLTVEVS